MWKDKKMGKTKDINYININWELCDENTNANYIVKKLLTEGKKAKESYNHKLAKAFR